ncbi:MULTISPECIES: hypothetical protein [Bradyrhizobium]|uniref:Uncharacterized protein n=1 Tax=Bradyrhizobium arachidis TaxID=858423 RepID=A0AAE7THY2_9BRAD|nr:hypothetical protein FOM02_38785 [Bradyrhizobium sp. SEMIA]QOZ68306.1 hypothetical protein WN72_19835 [Bradyrhizobium arachidis]
MLMDADNKGVDRLDSGIIGGGKRVHDMAPHAGLPPANEAVAEVVAGLGGQAIGMDTNLRAAG